VATMIRACLLEADLKSCLTEILFVLFFLQSGSVGRRGTNDIWEGLPVVDREGESSGRSQYYQKGQQEHRKVSHYWFYYNSSWYCMHNRCLCCTQKCCGCV